MPRTIDRRPNLGTQTVLATSASSCTSMAEAVRPTLKPPNHLDSTPSRSSPKFLSSSFLSFHQLIRSSFFCRSFATREVRLLCAMISFKLPMTASSVKGSSSPAANLLKGNLKSCG